MKSILLFLLGVLISASFALGGDNKAEKLVKKATQAMGGLDKIHALHTLIYRGSHGEGEHSSEAIMSRMRPSRRLIGCTPKVCDDWGTYLEGFDGERGWELNWPKQRLIRTVNKAEIALRCGAEFDPLFVDYKARGFRVDYLGEQTLLGRKLIALEVDPKNGCQTQIYYFDPGTYLVYAARLKMPVHARGDLIDTAVVYSDYREVNGVRLPFHSEDRNLTTGETLSFGTWKAIEANTLNDPSIFEAPLVHPKPATALVLKMLEEAPHLKGDDVLRRYGDFRQTAEGRSVDTEEDLDWVGYEFLKVDRYDLAIRIFQQEIVEHPNSSNAYDSLGDGYLQMGDKQKALAAFEKALDLNPKAAGTERKLKRLRSAKQ